MAEHPLCHRRVPQSFFPAMFFFLGGGGFLFFFVKKEKENFGPRKKERKNTKR